MKGLDLITPSWDRSQLEKETLRIFDICDGCRRCYNLCPSFNTLLDRIDAYESDTSRFAPQDYKRVEKECYYCKLCYNHCPYTPPHHYEIDFPRLMVAWKKQRAADDGATWRDKLLVRTDLIGKLGNFTATLSNWALRTSWVRGILEHIVGIHRRRQVMPFQNESFPAWVSKRQPFTAKEPAKGKVALFPSCLVNYQATDIGKATVQVLEKNGIEVVVPDGQRCCGMPSFDTGDTATIIQVARLNYQVFQPYLESGNSVVVPVPSCSLMLKREYPYLQPDQPFTQLSERTYDICEYLIKLKQEKGLSLDFSKNPGRIAYQVPCHLRDQNIGFKSKELMELTGATVQMVEKCSGHDGTWGAKTEFFDLSINIAKKAVRELGEESEFDLLASDCPLSALQLDQARCARSGTSVRPTLHPIQIVRDAYQLST